MQIANYLLPCGSNKIASSAPYGGWTDPAFTRIPQACAWGYDLAPASRALHLVPA